jgi:hypothetical protein
VGTVIAVESWGSRLFVIYVIHLTERWEREVLKWLRWWWYESDVNTCGAPDVKDYEGDVFESSGEM